MQLDSSLGHTERLIVIISLINTAIFYAITVALFIIARKNPLNRSLAAQKALWFAVIVGIVLPVYWLGDSVLPNPVRIALWIGLSTCTWWVLLEVYKTNYWYFWRWACKRFPKAASKRGRCNL